MIPDLTDQQLSDIPSAAEVKLYRWLRSDLPEDYLVIFQARWIMSSNSRGAFDGEIDFIVSHPKKGFITIEVKGGGIRYDAATDKWTSLNHAGVEASIKDPFKQALNAKYAIIKTLENRRGADRDAFANSTRGHAVFFPDIPSSSAIESSDRPRQIVGTAANSREIHAWIDRVFAYWARDTNTPPGSSALTILKDTFARPVEVKALQSTRLQLNEENLLRLTESQLKLLNFISAHNRVTIRGGAGTGKTLLAAEKARMLSREGYRTLLTCYNRPLADYLRSNLAGDDNVSVLSIHQLAHRYIDAANAATGRNLEHEMRIRYPGGDSWNVHMPLAMWEASEHVDTRFDAIICDEAQDVPIDFWMPLQNILTSFEESPFYIFLDDNQNVYAQDAFRAFPNAPFQLTENCRNSSEIHSVAYSRYKGPQVCASSKSGIPVIMQTAQGFENQASIIVGQIRKLLNDPGISPKQIAVLVTSRFRTLEMKEQLTKLQVSKATPWTASPHDPADAVLIETVKRFKGLEAPIVLLWIDDDSCDAILDEEIYVGASRARSQLVTISTGNNWLDPA